MKNRFDGTLYLMPGLGADHRMFAAQRGAVRHLRVIEWDLPGKAESVQVYAERLARRIPPGPFAVGGVSFGGVIAQEIAAILRPDSDPRFLSWARRAVLEWEPSASLADVSTLRIHGSRDALIRPREGTEVCVIKGAGHCVNMTHATLVNRAIRGFLEGPQ